jgi:ribosome maturation factor RimP
MAQMTLSEELMSELAAIAESNGCELIDARYRGGVLRLTLDNPEGVTLDHCQTVSKQVSAQLDISDWGAGRYTLEVTSPGLDRELFRPRDFERFTGSLVKVTWRPAEGKRTDTGRLERFVPAERESGGDFIEIRIDPDEIRHIPLQTIDVARLVPEF